MIHVISSFGVKPGKRAKFIEKFKANLPEILKEEGCIECIPAIDTDSGIEAQWQDETVVTVLEKWTSLEALHAHLEAPHMEKIHQETKHLTEDISFTILEGA